MAIQYKIGEKSGYYGAIMRGEKILYRKFFFGVYRFQIATLQLFRGVQ